MATSLIKYFCFVIATFVVAFAMTEFGFASEPAEGHADLTHGHAGQKLEDLIDIKSDRTFFTLIVFGLLCGGLYLVGWKKIKEGLEQRELGIAKQITDAKKASEDALAKLKEYERKLATAHAEATELMTQARKDAEAAGQRIVAESQAEATRQRDRALADIETAKQAALSELAGKSTDMAFSLARRVVGRELNTNDHSNLIQEALRQMPNRN